MDRTRGIYGLGALGLGVLSLTSGDFAFQWQPVPTDIAFHAALAYLSAALLIAGGLGAIWRRTSAQACLGLGLMFGVWVVALHLPKALQAPGEVASWNAVAEALALSLGGLIGWAMARRSGLTIWLRRAFGLGPVVFGVAHFAYAKFTASMVPAWLPPSQLFWAYLTGVGQLSAGLSLISGVLARLAATLLAAMYAIFVLILHVPRVAAAPDSRFEWTMLSVALTLTGAAWIVRGSLARR